MSPKEKNKIRKLKEKNRMLHKENLLLRQANSTDGEKLTSKDGLPQKKILSNDYKCYLLKVVSFVAILLIYLVSEYILVPQTIKCFVNNKTVNCYIESIVCSDEKEEFFSFLNRTNAGTFVITDITKNTNGTFNFIVEPNEMFREGVIIVPATSEVMTSFMHQKFEKKIVFDIVTLFTIFSMTFNKKISKSVKGIARVLGVFLILPILVTIIVVIAFQVDWRLGDVLLNCVIKYICVSFCIFSLVQGIFITHGNE